MENVPKTVIIAFVLSMIFWILLTAGLLVFGSRWNALRGFRERMPGQWRPALAIALAYLVSSFLSDGGLNPYGLAVFCQAWIGLTLADAIPDFEPLPVSRAILQRERVVRSLALFVLFALLFAVLSQLVGTLSMGITRDIFHEPGFPQGAMDDFFTGKVEAFFMLLAGAGIAEETLYRLVLLSLVWKLTGRRGLAILVSALLFAVYHLTPLDNMYLVFLQFPITQFVATALIGILVGWLFVKRGYETVVLAHTLTDWLPMLLFL